MVQKELELPKKDTNVYKLIGPMLVKKDLTKAKSNVSKRIEYLTTKMSHLEIIDRTDVKKRWDK